MRLNSFGRAEQKYTLWFVAMRVSIALGLVVLCAVTIAVQAGVTDTDMDVPAVPVEVTVVTSSTESSASLANVAAGLPGGKTIGALKGRTFWPAFVSSLIVIILAELGDKTFFIAAIGALRHPRLILFAGAYGALFVMTILSTLMGVAAGYVSHTVTTVVSIVLFLYFGVTLLRNGLNMDAASSAENKNKEIDEVEEELAKAGAESAENGGGDPPAADSVELLEGGRAGVKAQERATAHQSNWRTTFRACLSPIFLQFFLLTFVAEWGDRSQIATVSLASTDDPYGVTLGALIGHGLCTGLAVMGGKLLATRISEKTVTILGGVTFLLCALLTCVEALRAAVPEAAAAAAATGH